MKKLIITLLLINSFISLSCQEFNEIPVPYTREVYIDTPKGNFSFNGEGFYINDSLVLVNTQLYEIMLYMFDSVLVFKTDRLIPTDSTYLYREYKKQYELLKNYHEHMMKRWGIRNDNALKKEQRL